MEGALGDLGEDADHGVGPLLVVHEGEPEHVEAVRGELPGQQTVYQVDLQHQVTEIEQLAQHKPAVKEHLINYRPLSRSHLAP